ncbi:MAG TPA: FkbM family methyltransferase [Acidimicrobiales bacterium]|nr:FkbM family methyltransferase [Acidimicrobiales bacterium]
MKIVVHDYAGHAFPIELSRELAGRGHDVLHLYCRNVVGPRGALVRRPEDPSSLSIEGVAIGRVFAKYSITRRFVDELAYGRAAAARIASYGPRAVLSANTPLLSQHFLLTEARRSRRRFVYWWQDSYGVGVHAVVRRRAPRLAALVAWPFEAMERRMLSRSQRVVAISEVLRSQAELWRVDPGTIEVVPNWAPLDEVVPGIYENGWKVAHGFSGVPLVVYTGTLGLKHDPTMLADLASGLRATGARVVVVSEGPGRFLLEERRRRENLDNLVLMDYLPPELLGEVLAAADVLIAILEADAGAFSVPSKVLSYLCAGRPVVASLPLENQAAQVLSEAGAGICVQPGDRRALLHAVEELLRDPARRETMGSSGRRYAEAHFNRGAVADRFERILVGPGAGCRLGAAGVVAGTVSRIWRHPENRRRRWRAITRYVVWQVWERAVRRPWMLEIMPNRRILCHPHSPIAAAVLYYRLPDPMEMRFLLDYLTEGDSFVDVGANVGVYTLLASSVAGVRVVAIEPSTSSYERLRENVDLNDLSDSVVTLKAAVGRQPGEARLSTAYGPMNAIVDGSAMGETVDVTTVDQVLADHTRTKVAVMKVDVEGAELDVLAGAEACIVRDRPALIIEANDPERLAAFASDAGYTCVLYDTASRVFTPVPIPSCTGGNVLLLADLDEAVERLRQPG